MVHAKSRSREKMFEELASIVVDCAFHLHSDLGPGLLETVYEAILAKQLEGKGLRVERQKPVPIRYQGIELNEGFRLDILVEDELIIELKSVENFHPVHAKQLLTYLRLMDLPLGLLINFGAPLMKEGLHRVVNKHTNFASSRLRVHQELFRICKRQAMMKLFIRYDRVLGGLHDIRNRCNDLCYDSPDYSLIQVLIKKIRYGVLH